jgi:hypothetical protein
MATTLLEQPPVEVWRVWEEFPRETQLRMIREAVGARFGDGVKAERIGVYKRLNWLKITHKKIVNTFQIY